jgi:ribonuclease G
VIETPTTIYVNRTGAELRAAVVEDGQLVALQVERGHDRGVVGGVYKGRVVRIVPGMQAAFLDVGLPRAAFLYVGDLVEQKEPPPPPDPTLGEDAEVPDAVAEAITGAFEAVREARVEVQTLPPQAQPERRKPKPIQEQLSPGQELVVQVSKEPLGTKGARVTAQIALPGRYLVYLPQSDHVGVSRRIESPAERDRLRAVCEGFRQPGEGMIVRTVCVDRSEEELRRDAELLREDWRDLHHAARTAPVPSRLYAEPDLVVRIVRDLLNGAVTKLVFDDRGDFDRARTFASRHLPRFLDRIALYEDPTPVFESTGLESQIEQALARKVRLPSGGSIVIDHTEALTAIDVNSGRYTGGRNLAEMTLKVNLEAAEAIVRHLRLREIGGLIVIDFIDMEEQAHRKQLFERLQELLERDPARSTVLPISEFGLVEMTRRRVRENLSVTLLDTCDACSGRSRSRSVETVAYQVLREALRQVRAASVDRPLQLRVAPSVAGFLEDVEGDSLEALGRRVGQPVRIVRDGRLDREDFAISFVRDKA